MTSITIQDDDGSNLRLSRESLLYGIIAVYEARQIVPSREHPDFRVDKPRQQMRLQNQTPLCWGTSAQGVVYRGDSLDFVSRLEKIH